MLVIIVYTFSTPNGGMFHVYNWLFRTSFSFFFPKVPPAIVVRPPISNTVEAENSVEFGCVAYGNPIPNIYWSRPGCSNIKNSSAENVFVYNSMVTVNNITMRKSVLQICSITTTDEAEYGCGADNGITIGESLAEPSVRFYISVNTPTTAPPTTNPPPNRGTWC